MRITTSGNEGRLTVPFETSPARFARKASAEALSSAVVAALLAVADMLRLPADGDATFAIGYHC
jgi:hypothetical protein